MRYVAIRRGDRLYHKYEDGRIVLVDKRRFIGPPTTEQLEAELLDDPRTYAEQVEQDG